MPEFPQLNPELTREHALNMILSSIAMEELALSHIINAEGEKIQYILRDHAPCGCCAGADDVLAVNKSVTGLLETVMQNQMLLKSKMEKVLEYLPKPPPDPPAPPCPPPKPGPGPGPGCGPANPPSGFEAAPGIYCRGDALSWSEKAQGCAGTGCRAQPWGGAQPCSCTQPCGCGGNPVQIPLPGCCGCLSLHIVLEGCLLTAQPETAAFELQVACPNKWVVSKCFYHTGGGCRFTLSGNAVIQQGGSPCSCHAALFLRSPQKIRIEQGKMTFSCR